MANQGLRQQRRARLIAWAHAYKGKHQAWVWVGQEATTPAAAKPQATAQLALPL